MLTIGNLDELFNTLKQYEDMQSPSYFALIPDPDLAHEWAKMPLRRRHTNLLNAMGIQSASEVPAFGLFEFEGEQGIVHPKMTSYLYLLSSFCSDTQVLEWLVKGDSTLPSVPLRDVVAQALKYPEPITLTPCRVKYLDKPAGVVLSLNQFLGFASLVMMMHYVGLVNPKSEQLWTFDHEASAFGLTAFKESVGEVTSAMMKRKKTLKKRVIPQLGKSPQLLAKAFKHRHGDALDTEIRLIHLTPDFLKEQVEPLRQLIPAGAEQRIDWDDPDLRMGVMGWLKPLFMPPQPTAADAKLVESLNRCDQFMQNFLATHAPIPELESEEARTPDSVETASNPVTTIPDADVDSPDRRKAQRLEREQKFDRLPNVLEGLDAFQALYRAAEQGGFFEKFFVGTPMVVDRLRYEAGEDKPEDSTCERIRQSQGFNGNGFAAMLTEVVKGNLVFANAEVFKAMQARRYAARAMLRARGRRPDRHLPDIQVLAPHEFGQVPGFVAGQYRQQRDRLCTVMLTYDPSLWELSLRERKTLIELSKAPKLWVFPRQWLFDLSSAYHWWDAGYFGTPRDPAILDFIVPNGDYVI